MSRIISVSQFNTYIHNILANEDLLQFVQLYGEISGISYSGNNVYFSIKDENAVLNCVRFGIKPSDFIGKEGEMVLVTGSPNYYVKGGRFSFNVVKIEPYGQGLLYKQFLELKAKLEALGLFDASKKKPLPAVIKRIGVVTSETGAVIRDIIDVSHRRNPLLDIVLYPAKVQGVGAENTIIAGIEALDQIEDVDVIIVARGGGSAEDMSTFNAESVAMAIANASKPIISAVGHETDFTIADFVADLRAPTPSAGAELVSTDLAKLKFNMQNATLRLLRITETFYQTKQEKVENLISKMSNTTTLLLQQSNADFQNLVGRFSNASTLCIKNYEHNFDVLVQKLEAVNPIKILRLGYAQIDKGNKVVSSIKKIKLDDKINVRLQDGTLVCRVEDKEEKK